MNMKKSYLTAVLFSLCNLIVKSNTICIDLPFPDALPKVRCWWYSDGFRPECGGFKPDKLELKWDLDSQVYGQHIATQTVFNAISSHWSNDDPSKALVLSFHGPPGVGKTHLSNLIVKNMYCSGLKSPFAHRFYAGYVFDDPNKISLYKDQLQNWIQTNVSRCERSIFIFEEVDQMPEGIIDSIKLFVESQPTVKINNVYLNFRKSIFIFVSNIGSSEIKEQCISAKQRESIQLADLRPKLRSSALENKNGLQRSAIVKHNLIDHYVPFLPLTEDHVRECTINEISRVNPRLKYRREFFEKVLNELEWYSGMENEVILPNRCAPAHALETRCTNSVIIYSVSGCTKVASIVALYINKFAGFPN